MSIDFGTWSQLTVRKGSKVKPRTNRKANIPDPAIFASIALSLLTLVYGLGNPAEPAPPDSILIRGATLIDGTGAAATPNSAILIENNKIAAVGQADELKAPAGTEVVDATGKFIIPGLIDAHVHYREWLGEVFLAHGVTSVIDLGNLTEWVIAVRDAINKGKMRGPRIFTSGNFLDGGDKTEAFTNFVTRVKRSGRHKTFVKTVEEAQQAARELIAQGVDTIKVYQHLTPEQLRAIIQEARKHNLAVVGHSDTVQESVRQGINGITHLWGVSASTLPPEKHAAYLKGELASPYAHMDPVRVDELIAMLVRNNVYINPLLEHEHKAFTGWAERHEQEDHLFLQRPELAYIPVNARLGMLSMYYRVRNYARRLGENFPRLETLSAADREEFQKGYQIAQEFTRKFVARGGKLFLGTDTGGGAKEIPGLAVPQEMEVLAETGLSPAQILEAATKNNAQLFRIADKVGTLEPGKLADLIILSADPLADISNVRKIDKVMKDGQWVDTSYHPDYSIPIPDPTRMHLESSSYYPVPVIHELKPPVTVEGSLEDVTITIYGTSFMRGSEVRFNGIGIESRFVDNKRLEAVIPASLFSRVGTFPVEVVNPPPGGGVSEWYGFIVKYR